MLHYDLIVIGGGPGGYAAAAHAAKHGMNTALVERDRLGGTCLQRGCVPTKAYLHATEQAVHALPYAPTAISAFSRRAMLQRKDEVVESLTQGVAMLMKSSKVTVFQGSGTLQNAASPFLVRVSEGDLAQEITAGKVLLATGSKPVRLPVPGCGNPDVFTSDDLLGEAGAEAFESLLIVGGGVIGVEMACIYARLGVAVTILEAEKNCLPMMDRDLSRSAEAMLKGLGVQVLNGALLKAVEQTADGFLVRYEKGGEMQVSCQRVLLATGRRPQTEGLLAEGVEMTFTRGAIEVDEQFCSSIPGVYAIGDVNGRMQLAHAAHAQGLAAVSHMLGLPAPIHCTVVPSCVYTTPEIASVGLTQEEAKALGMEVSVAKALTTQNARTLIEGLGRGFVKLVVENNTRRLLGAQLFCGRATDLLGELTSAIVRQQSVDELLVPMRAHPTFYEAITEAAQAASRLD